MPLRMPRFRRRPRKRNGRRRRADRRRWWRRTAWGLAALFLVGWLPVLGLRFVAPPVTAFMLQQNTGGYRYEWADWQALGVNAKLAVVASEDQKFPYHHGFDLDAIGDALADHASGDTLRGASTISQQVAKNLFLWSGRSWLRKALEAWFTLLIEATWPKRRILEVYLNVAEFGRGVYGVPAAARRFFGKPASALTVGEAALLAAVLPNPRRLDVDRPSDYVRERQRWIIGQMGRLDAAAIL